MSKTLWWIALILAGVSLLLIQYKNKKEDESLLTADRGFTINSISEVNKIVIRHIKLQPLVFEKSQQTWKLNDKYDVDPAVFVNIEKVLTNMRMLYIPSKNATKTVLESIQKNGIQVDLYKNAADKEPFKMFFVGTDTQKGDGTYMILAGTSQPYVMHLPGLSGGLRSRFEQPEINFRDRFIFKKYTDNITSLTMEYPGDYKSSFSLTRIENTWSVKSLTPGISSPAIPNENLINAYISKFENLGAEMFITDANIISDIRKNLPSAVLTIKSLSGNEKIYKIYGYENITENKGYAKSPEEIRSQNRIFIDIDSSEVLTAQNRVFSNLFLSITNFAVKNK